MQRLETWVTDQRAPEGASLTRPPGPAVNEIAYLDQWNNEISRALTDLHSLSGAGRRLEMFPIYKS